MARKSYKPPIVDIVIGSGGEFEIKGDITVPGSGEHSLDPTQASYSAWKLAVQNANLDIDMSYEGYLKWMTENGFAAYIHEEDS